MPAGAACQALEGPGGPGLWLLAKAPRVRLCVVCPASDFSPFSGLFRASEDLTEALKLHLELSCCAMPTTFSRSEHVHRQLCIQGRHVSARSW